MEEIDIQIAEILDKHNSKAIPDFEGYSPNNMHFLLTDPFGDNSPIKIQKLTEEEYKAIPILNQVKYIISLIKEKGEVKLTKKGKEY